MRYFEDIEVGKISTSGPYELTESGIIDFATQWDPFPFHTDVQAAKDSVFAGLTASNCHTVSIACRLFHEIEMDAVLAAMGHEYQYPNPARVGDQLTLETKAIEKRESRSKPDRGIVQGETYLKNQDKTITHQFSPNLVLKMPP